MADYVLRNLSGNHDHANARKPGDPGTRRLNRLNKIAEHYTGQSPTAIAIAAGKLDIALVRQVEEETGMPVFGPPAEYADPADAIMDEIAWSLGYIRDLGSLVHKFELSQLVEEDTVRIDEEKTGGGESGDYTLSRTERRKQINLLWTMYERERKHLASVASAAVKAGLELRRIRIAEAQLDRVQAAIVLALQDLGLDTGDTNVRKAIGTRIAELQTGADFTPDPVKLPAAQRTAAPVTPPPPPAEF